MRKDIRGRDFTADVFLHYFDHASAKIRQVCLRVDVTCCSAHAVNCANSCLMIQADALNAHMNDFLTRLFQLANDTDAEVQRELCRALSLLLDSHTDMLVPQLSNIVEFMLMRSQDTDERTALEACEFWLTLSEQRDVCREAIRDHLPRLIPILLHAMRYNEFDIILLKVCFGTPAHCATVTGQRRRR